MQSRGTLQISADGLSQRRNPFAALIDGSLIYRRQSGRAGHREGPRLGERHSNGNFGIQLTAEGRIIFDAALKMEAAYFVDCIMNDKTPFNDGVAGLHVVRMLEAADQSLQQKGKIIQL